MRSFFIISGVIAAFFAFICGATDWYLTSVISDEDYAANEDRIKTILQRLWIAKHALSFIAFFLVGLGSLLRFPKSSDSGK